MSHDEPYESAQRKFAAFVMHVRLYEPGSNELTCNVDNLIARQTCVDFYYSVSSYANIRIKDNPIFHIDDPAVLQHQICLLVAQVNLNDIFCCHLSYPHVPCQTTLTNVLHL